MNSWGLLTIWAALLIPLLPLVAGGLIAASGRRWPGQGHRPAVAAVLASFALSVMVSIAITSGERLEIPLYTWIAVPGFHVRFGFWIDRLTVVMLLLVTGISSVVHLYSVRYMQGDPAYDRFFGLLSLVTWAVIMVVLAENLLMLYFFWEIVGFGLYLLLAHNHQHSASVASAQKGFLVNRAADVPFLLGVVLAFSILGTLGYPGLFARAAALAGGRDPFGGIPLHGPQPSIVAAIALLLFAGAAGRSANIPFHLWLADTNETPTPVSALMHAGIVNAGGYLLARLSPLFHLAPSASDVVFLTGAATALYGTTIMLAQSDIKRIFGYSTMGQMGFMTMEAGLGAYAIAIFHLVAHGLFKATQFLGAGGAIASAGHHPQPPDRADLYSPWQRTSHGISVALAVILPVTAVAATARAWGFSPTQEGAAVLSLFGWTTVLLALFGVIRTGRTQSWRLAAATGLVLAVPAAIYLAGVTAITSYLSPVLALPSPPSSPHPGGGLLPAAIALGILGLPAVLGLRRLLSSRVMQRAHAAMARITDLLYVLALNRGHEDALSQAVIRPVVALSIWVDRIL